MDWMVGSVLAASAISSWLGAGFFLGAIIFAVFGFVGMILQSGEDVKKEDELRDKIEKQIALKAKQDQKYMPKS